PHSYALLRTSPRPTRATLVPYTTLFRSIHDTLTRQKIPLRTVEPGVVRMYVCGMTVYDFCHLGHARMLVGFDVVQQTYMRTTPRSEEHTSELQSREKLVCRLLLEKKKRR